MRKLLMVVMIMAFVFVASCGGDDDSGDTGNTGNTGNSGDTGNTGDTGDTGTTSYAVEVAGEQCEGYPENMSELMINDPCLFNVCMWADVVGSYKPTDKYEDAKDCFDTVFLPCHEECDESNDVEMSNDCGKDKLQECIENA